LIAGRQDSLKTAGSRAEKAQLEAKVNDAFDAYLRFGMEGLEPEERQIMNAHLARHRRVDERRSARAQTVTTSGGGYLIPQGFSDQLEKNMKAFGGVEQACRRLHTETGNTLPWPTVDDTGNTGRLLAINTAGHQTASCTASSTSPRTSSAPTPCSCRWSCCRTQRST
jgi:HK97 family phage major capsid protein